jgi:hypothetical protein
MAIQCPVAAPPLSLLTCNAEVRHLVGASILAIEAERLVPLHAAKPTKEMTATTSSFMLSPPRSCCAVGR